MTEPNDNWPLVTHSRRGLAELATIKGFVDDVVGRSERTRLGLDIALMQECIAIDQTNPVTNCPSCPHTVHLGRCFNMVTVEYGEDSCKCRGGLKAAHAHLWMPTGQILLSHPPQTQYRCACGETKGERLAFAVSDTLNS